MNAARLTPVKITKSVISGAVLTGTLLSVAVVPATAADSAGSALAETRVSKSEKLKKLGSLTGDGQKSQDRWFDAYANKNKPAIKKYKFTWKTDGCSKSPDEIPGGYNFRNSCWRHDFGYRNYKSTVGAGTFRSKYKKGVDKAFLGDMKRQCNRKFWADPLPSALRKKVRAACHKTAQQYYNAVVVLG